MFERVAKGELKAQEPAVEVDGLTSDEAKTTQDFNVQFEVARHPELLAFLAMNPSPVRRHVFLARRPWRGRY